MVIGASIGIAMAPRDAIGADHPAQIADMALYWAKAEQRGTWRFFEPEMDSRAQARRSLELDLRNALANEAFEVYYQPLFDLRTRRIIDLRGAAALAASATRHDLAGRVHPGRRGDGPDRRDRQVGARARPAANAGAGPASRVAVNISANQFRRGDVPASCAKRSRHRASRRSRLEIEITEIDPLQDTQATRAACVSLRDLGVRISLDDFGTGYSSLSYLHSFPLNKVKIDRSFLEGLDDNERMVTLLRGIARLSAELGLRSPSKASRPRSSSRWSPPRAAVDEVQGYLFGVPMPASAIRTLLTASMPKRD